MKKLFLSSLISFPILGFSQSFIEALRPSLQIKAKQVQQTYYKGKPIKGQGQIIAVIDSGINYFHPDIAGKVAINNGEVIDNKDNDQNGYVDDNRGWNFYSKNGLVIDDHGHGTHVSGTIIANAYGIAPSANVVPIKVTINPNGEISELHLIDAIKYAVDNGIKIINLSLSGIYAHMPITEYAIKEAIKYAREKDALLIVAAGNNGLDITNLPVYPANINADNLLTICAVDENNILANFSNYSKKAVHLCAPGVDIASASHDYFPSLSNSSKFRYMSGTSMAAPIVSGVAALLWAMEPSLKAKDIRDIILSSARKNRIKTPHLHSFSQTGAVIDAHAAVQELIRRTR